MKWKQIIGYEGLYEISDTGLVKALKRTWITGKNLLRIKDEHLLKPIKRREGYYCVTLTKDGKQRQEYIHKLVAKHFIYNDLGFRCVNHIDGNKLNNDATNLEWCTHKQNNDHALKLGLRVNPSGGRNGYAKKVFVDGIEYESIRDFAAKTGISDYQAYYRIAKTKK